MIGAKGFLAATRLFQRTACAESGRQYVISDLWPIREQAAHLQLPSVRTLRVGRTTVFGVDSDSEAFHPMVLSREPDQQNEIDRGWDPVLD
ncbi:uncharacterized protein PG986_014356 [Apiospora aurea]|uniref:Uncharacterized protein n=1 Tax=Apiospora aurea TaxID=335848 RepID=A0ABR1PSS3_9PEZI